MQDEFTETYRLPSGCRVEVSRIRGPVNIECRDTDEAQVHIVSHADDRADLDQGKVVIEQGENGLVVRGAEEQEVSYEVALKLPRQIALVIAGISGPLHVGEVDGPVTVNSLSGPCHIAGTNGALQVKSVSGKVEVGRLKGGLNIFSVSGPVSVGILALDENGIQIKSISGPVELFFENEVDASMNIEHVSGKINVQLEGATRKADGVSVQVVVGEGRSPVLISSVSGPVRIKRGLPQQKD